LNVDALAMMAETWLAHGPASRKGGDHHMVTVYVDANVLADDDPDGVCEIDGGTRLAPETARRLMCDSSVVWMLQDADGKPVNVSTRTRSIPPSLRRAVHARDQGCDFPVVVSARSPTSTTFATAPRVVTTRWSTWPSCAGTTTGSSTRAAGGCAAAGTAT
jgi:hypothetical protein